MSVLKIKDIYLPHLLKGSALFLFLLVAFVGQGQGTITTMRPPATLDINPVCAGSVIDVPFVSSGTFASLNVYYAELSDSAGNFLTCDTLGSLFSNQDYGAHPGTVSGVIPLNFKDGCDYYIRVVADTPTTTGSVYGPFCIQHCDIYTNDDQPVQACVWSCFKGPGGYNNTISYNIHQYDSNEHYVLGNKFEVQLLNSQNFTITNTGALGKRVDTTSSKMLLHVPCADSLTNIYHIPPGLYYMRVIATNSNIPDSSFGTLVHLTIGEPSDSLVLAPPGNGFCVGTEGIFYVSPGRYMVAPYNSNYTWWEGSSFGLYQFADYPLDSIGLILNNIGTYTIICQENSYGCFGDTVSKQITVEPCLGIPTLPDAEKVQIYPNPASDECTIQFSNNDAQIVRLFNITGQKIWEDKIDGLETKQIPVASFPSGVYIIEVLMRDGSSIIRKLEIIK